MEAATLPVRLGLSVAECRRLVGTHEGLAMLASGRIVARQTIDDLRTRLAAAVAVYHAEHPLEPGMPVQSLRTRLAVADTVMEAALEGALVDGAITVSSGIVRQVGWVPILAGGDAQTADRVLSTLDQSGSEPPSSEELAAQVGAPVEPVLRYLERRGDIVQVETNRYYAAHHLTSLVERLRGLMAHGNEVSPADIRDGLGLSRKYLIPFLEYCDRVGYTNRHATGRVWKGA
jgi:selenocysteine-specific elongation factor